MLSLIREIMSDKCQFNYNINEDFEATLWVDCVREADNESFVKDTKE